LIICQILSSMFEEEKNIIRAPHHSSWIIFTRLLINDNDYLRVNIYINIKLIKLYFLLRKDIHNNWNINIISFFNYSSMCFIINIYLDNQQTVLKYLKNTEVNLNNVLIITENFDIRNNSWDPSYSHYLTYVYILQEVANSLNLELSMPINSVST